VRAVVAGGDGVPAIEDRPDPVPGAGQLLVAVRAAGLNRADLAQLHGVYPAPPGAPADVLGLELAGTVISTGPGVLRFSEGDRVMAVVGGGGQAELAVLHEREAMPVPPGLSWEEAGGLAEVFTTAHDALFTQAQLSPGERLLVNGAAGGVGTAAVQLGAACGAQVYATVRSVERRGEVEALGATVLASCVPDEVKAAAPFDVVLELVGAPNVEADLESLSVGGRISVIGISAGAIASVNLGLLMARRGRIHGSTLRARPLEEKALAARLVEAHVLPLLESGRVHVIVDSVFPLAEAPAAYERFAAGGKLGKVVLRIGS
jgi:NADPH2:quinone reductase